MPLIFRWKIIFIVSYQTMKYKFNYTPLVKFFNFIAQIQNVYYTRRHLASRGGNMPKKYTW